MKRLLTAKHLLVLAFVTETFCATYALKYNWLIDIATILYFISGLVIAGAMLAIRAPKFTPKLKLPYSKTDTLYVLALIGIMGIVMCHFSKAMMDDAPLNYKEVDMLPIIQTMSRRFLEGRWRHVYDIIPEIWGGMKPIYLPAMWLPFSIPLAFNADIRWLTVAVLFFVFALFIWIIHPTKQRIPSLLKVIAVFALFWWMFTEDAPGLVPYTEEGVVIFYYSILVISLFSTNYWMIGIAASLCMLSRYSFIGWMPAMLIYLLAEKDKKHLLRFAAAGIICFVVLVVLPFGFTVFENTIELPGRYIDFASRVWHDSGHIFYETLGFAKFFGPNRVALQHKLLISLSFILPSLFMLVVLWLRKKGKAVFNIPLATLKLSLVIFYNFIDVPYLYLFYTSTFVSLVAIVYLLREKKKTHKGIVLPIETVVQGLP